MNLDKILPLVQRPARYINHEWNSHPSKTDGVSVCFCFPDLYEVGASNLGIEILYHLVNSTSGAWAERCYAPATDLEDRMKKEGIPLFSLESHKPLKDFDIIGFSLHYELCATNILNMMSLAGIPQFAKDRASGGYPLIIGGGPVMANPEPYADFFDALVIGEGEDVILEIIERVKGQGAGSKETLLRELAKIEGVYVPSLYDVSYNGDGTVKQVEAKNGAPAVVKKRSVDIAKSFFPAKQIVPFVQTVHNRLNVEIARGCPRRCRFCQAARYYNPFRMRPAEQVLSLAAEGISSTGYEEVAYSSLSCTDYPELEKLLAESNRKFGLKKVQVSLPSLRCDKFSLKVAEGLSHNKRASLTFAPEAGTERLRAVIGKDLPDAQVQETLLLAWKMGWKLVKLYFMIGLPTETEADIKGIAETVKSIKRAAKNLNFNVTASPFVPKAQTAFQWTAMEEKEKLISKLNRLRKSLPASVKGHYVEASVLEGIFARGDRRLAGVIYSAWQKGCRFDQWREHLNVGLWEEAFKDAGISEDFYVKRERREDEVFPWEHVSFSHDKAALRRDYEAAFNEAPEPRSPARAEKEISIPAFFANPQGQTAFQKFRLKFARKGPARFLSHLEQIDVIRRAIRRTGLPVCYTSGFSPQIKAAFGPAISVGYESLCEYAELEMTRRVEAEEVKALIGSALPEGFSVLEAKRMPVFFPSLDSLVNVADYEVAAGVPRAKIDELSSAGEIIIERKKGGETKKVDAKPLIMKFESENGRTSLRLRFGPGRNVKPEKLVQLAAGLSDDGAKCLAVTRTGLFIEKKDGSISEP
ncbi:MAG: TIGR03960 family B12-binding radical SAM protein [Endomicrobiales bacterium]|nr:TIGR03960 family B12-binding radical SAM protein [Endomicrobiales bacterium]